MSAPLTDSLDYASFALKEGADSFVLYLSVEGMHCAGCAATIEKTLRAQPHVSAHVSLAHRRLVLRWRGAATDANALIAAAAKTGYRFYPFDPKTAAYLENKETRLLRLLTLFSGFIMLVMMAGLDDFSPLTKALLSGLVLFLPGQVFWRPALRVLRHGHSNMDVPISLALFLAWGGSLFDLFYPPAPLYFDSVVMLAFFLLIGRYLDQRTRGATRTAALDLLALTTATARVLERSADGTERLLATPIPLLACGVLVYVAPGETVPADGVVEEGASDIDVRFLTGESLPQTAQRGTRVYAGTINLSGPLRVRVTAIATDSLLGQTIRLMEKAEQGSGPYVRLADRVAQFYTPAVLTLSVLSFWIWFFALGSSWQDAMMKALTVLIITCPCALGLAVPAVQVLASGLLFRRGILVKTSDALEKIAAVTSVVFDKTGCLTLGQPRFVRTDADADETNLALALAQTSRHPLARALVAENDVLPAPLSAVTEKPGFGVEGIVNGQTVRLGRRSFAAAVAAEQRQDSADESVFSALWLGSPSFPLRGFFFEDALRPQAQETIDALRAAGLNVFLLSGDRETIVSALAQKLGLSSFRAEATPLEKTTFIESCRANGQRVLMVGDGLNDAGALIAADASLSPSSALDIAQNAADVVFKGKSLEPVAFTHRLACKALRRIKENIVLSLCYNLIAVPLAFSGLISPPLAALAMSASSLLVVLNAQRLRFFR